MSMFEVLGRHGTARLLCFTGALLLFLALHLARIPLVLVARVLEVALGRIDTYAARQSSRPTRGPINHFYAYREGEAHVRT